MPYISACVIVRNEEKNLPRWLKCMSALADELVVVDTGSTDKTVEIARQAGAKVYSFSWINDFAAAKNYAIEQAMGKWIIFLDADEYIRTHDYDKVIKIIKKYDADKSIIGFVNPLINIDSSRNDAYISTVEQIRIFRKLPPLRYVGAIHEMLQYSGDGKKSMPLIDDYTIYHTGYSSQLMPDKYKRNLKMLEMSINKYGKRIMDNFYLADCYYGLRQYEKAIQCAKAYLNDERILGEESRPYGILIQSMIFLDYPLSEILTWVRKAMTEFPYGAEFKIMEGYAREAAGEYANAVLCFDEAEKLYKESKAGKITHVDEAGGAMNEMYTRRRALLERQKQIKEQKTNEVTVHRPYISACVIVRNEEKNLPCWLKCMSALADELVIVDTGSTDKTVEIARQSGAKVYSFLWINDFAAARNYAIEQASGKWIFFLDADEYWEKKDFPVIRRTLQQFDKQEHVIGFVCRLVNIDKDNGNKFLNENLHIRIFRNLPQLRYVGAVHEQLVYKGTGKKEMTLLPDAVIYHTGYSASTDISKAQRNLDIMQAQQAAGNERPEDICYITDCYYSLQDYARAAETARTAIERKVILPGRETRMYNTLLQSLQMLGHKWQELVPIVKKAEQAFPYVPDFRALLGFAAWQQGAKKEAGEFFAQSKRIYQDFLNHRQDATATYSDEMQGFLPKIEACLAELRRKCKISATVITKNEEEDLPRWLECMQNLADEIIVVDTGSTDRTVEIAQAAGAKVVHFDWIDDFSAAKNFAIDQTQGEWVLFLDADEYILPEDYAGVKAAIEHYEQDGSVIGLFSDWINVDKTKNNAYISKGYQIRVFRKMPELRYEHMIHELLQYSGKGKKSMPYVDDFRIYHTGYSAERMPEKYRRNLRLLELSMEKYGRRQADEAYLADCYFGLQKYEKAIDHAKAYLEGEGRTDGAENRPYGIWIQSLIFLDCPLEEITAVVAKALAEFPYSAEFKILEGFVREDKGDYLGAEACYREADRIYAYAKEHNVWQKKLLTDEAGNAMPKVYANLCRLLLWQGSENEAWAYLQRALAADKYCPRVCSLLLKFLAGQDDVYWIEVLNQIYDKEQDAAFLLEKLPARGRDKVRLYYQRQLKDGMQAEHYLLAGRLEAATAAVAEDTAALLQLGIRGLSHEATDKLLVLMPREYQAVVMGKPQTMAERSLAGKTARIQKWLAGIDGQME